MFQHKVPLLVTFLLLLNDCLSFDTRYRADDPLSKNKNKTCSIMTVSTTCDRFIYYYIWDSTGSPIKQETVAGGTFSDCYDPDECYSLQMVPVENDCEYEITMDGETTNKGKFGFTESNTNNFYLPDSLILVGDCPKQGLELYVSSYPDLTFVDIGYSLHRFGKIDDIEDGSIDAGHLKMFSINSTECILFEPNFVSDYIPVTYFILQNGITIDNGTLTEQGKSYGCPQQTCPDQAIIIKNLYLDPIAYNLTENEIAVANGSISTASSEEICIDTSKCNIISSNESGYDGHARYFLFEDGEIYDKDYSSYYYSYSSRSYWYRIGACDRKCDHMPLLSTTNRGKEIVSHLATISGMDILVNTQSAQYKAACWLIYDDDRSINASNSNLVQRYVLALFYFATNGFNWTNSFYFLTGKDECKWNAYGGGFSCFDFWDNDFNLKLSECMRKCNFITCSLVKLTFENQS